jgi:hypothetical protein
MEASPSSAPVDVQLTGAMAARACMQDLIRHFRDVELGGRVMSATTGSAPSAPDVLAWLEDMLGTRVVDGYGSTEAGMMMLDGKLQHTCAASSVVLVCIRSTPWRPGMLLYVCIDQSHGAARTLHIMAAWKLYCC